MSDKLRRVLHLVQPQPTSDGAGVRLLRSIGGSRIPQVDPFLLLDEFKSDRAGDYIAGFPDHPHRGFETVTYMLAGAMQHRDHKGNQGNLRAGSVQWMTAGRGIIHSEMPQQEDGLMWGFQLWVNLPASDKMCDPNYQDIEPERVPEVHPLEGVRVRVIAGEAFGVSGAVEGIATRPLYVDMALDAGMKIDLPIPPGHNAFCYPFEGGGRFGVTEDSDGTEVNASQLAVLEQGGAVRVHSGPEGVRFLLVAGAPIGEPVARYGPFVMNTRDEIYRAIEDYQSGRLLD